MSDTYIPEQPKLALREDEEMGGANSNATKDGSLHNEYKKEGESMKVVIKYALFQVLVWCFF